MFNFMLPWERRQGKRMNDLKLSSDCLVTQTPRESQKRNVTGNRIGAKAIVIIESLGQF